MQLEEEKASSRSRECGQFNNSMRNVVGFHRAPFSEIKYTIKTKRLEKKHDMKKISNISNNLNFKRCSSFEEFPWNFLKKSNENGH